MLVKQTPPCQMKAKLGNVRCVHLQRAATETIHRWFAVDGFEKSSSNNLNGSRYRKQLKSTLSRIALDCSNVP